MYTPKTKTTFKTLMSPQSVTSPHIKNRSHVQSLPTLTFGVDLTEQNELLKMQLAKLEAELKTTYKEIQRLNYLNQFLMQQNSNKESLISNERKNYTKLKDLLQFDRHTKPVELLKVKPKQSIRHSIMYDGQSFVTQVTQAVSQLESQPPQNERVMEDQFKLEAILDLDVTESDSIQSYTNDTHLRFLSSLVADEDKFVQILQGSGYQKIFFIFEKLKKIIGEHKQFFQTLMRVKQFIRAAIHMTTSQTLDDVLDNIIQESTKYLECDRATCFILDENKGQLWSRVAKGVSGVIRFPADQGVAGYVATNKSLLNIPKAYSDPRFNADQDKRTNYKTNTILCVPILLQDKCLGVVQCINKKDGIFSKEDECLSTILCEFSKVILSHAITVDERVLTIMKLRQSLKQSVVLRGLVQCTLREKLMQSEKLLKQMMNVDQVRIAAYRDNKLIFVQENGVMQEVIGLQGVLGQSIKTMRQVLVHNCYDNVDYSPLVDLQTKVPVACIPIMEGGVAYGAFMLPNVRSIQSILAQTEPRLQTIDEEVLMAFSQQLVQLFEQ